MRIREESGWPPLAAPIGQILGSQALLNVLSARRYGTVLDEFRALVQGGYGGRRRRSSRRSRARSSCSRRAPTLEDDPAERRGRARAGGGPRRVRGGSRPPRDVRRRGRDAPAHDPPAPLARGVLLGGDVDAQRAERIRELVKIVQESGVGEIEIEDEGMRVSVRRADEPPAPGARRS